MLQLYHVVLGRPNLQLSSIKTGLVHFYLRLVEASRSPKVSYTSSCHDCVKREDIWGNTNLAVACESGNFTGENMASRLFGP